MEDDLKERYASMSSRQWFKEAHKNLSSMDDLFTCYEERIIELENRLGEINLRLMIALEELKTYSERRLETIAMCTQLKEENNNLIEKFTKMKETLNDIVNGSCQDSCPTYAEKCLDSIKINETK